MSTGSKGASNKGASNKAGGNKAGGNKGGNKGGNQGGNKGASKQGGNKGANKAAKPAAATTPAATSAAPAVAATPAAAPVAKPAASTPAAKPAASSTPAASSATPAANAGGAPATNAAGKPIKPKGPRQKHAKSAAKKIVKRPGQKPTAYESTVAQALFDVQSKGEGVAALKDLQITAAKEFDLGAGKQATVLFVPVPQLKRYRAIQSKLVQELEKSAAFRDRQIFIVANRTILAPPSKKNRVSRQQRPRSRTTTSVHEAILDDLVFPSEIVGKSVRVKLDNSKVIKVQLDPKDRDRSRNKTDAYSRVYKRLTGKHAVFEFPAYSLADLQGHIAAEKAARVASK